MNVPQVALRLSRLPRSAHRLGDTSTVIRAVAQGWALGTMSRPVPVSGRSFARRAPRPQVRWKDLLALSPREVASEILLSSPWLVASLVVESNEVLSEDRDS